MRGFIISMYFGFETENIKPFILVCLDKYKIYLKIRMYWEDVKNLPPITKLQSNFNGEKVSGGNRNIKLKTTSHDKVREWVSAINEVGSKRSESWCSLHRFNSFAPTRGLVEDGSQAQWFIDGKAAFEAIASSIENASSEVKFSNIHTVTFICWICHYNCPL